MGYCKVSKAVYISVATEDEKTTWGKEELKKRMDKLLIECMGRYL